MLESGLYVALALGAVLPALGRADVVPGDGVDMYGTIWFFWWIRKTVELGISPSFTDLFFYPYGKDIFAHTGNNFVDAYLSIPLQWLFGNPRYYAVWVFTVLVGNAAAFRVLARHVLRDRLPVVAATALFTVNPYVLFELTAGRPTQAMMWFVLLALWGLLRAGRGWWVGPFLGVMVALAGWSYWFYGYFFAFAALWIVPVETVRRWRSPEGGRGEALRYLGHVAVGAAVAFVCVLPGMVGMASKVSGGAVPGMEDGSTQSLFAQPRALANGVGSQLQGYFITEPKGARYFHHPAWLVALLGWGVGILASAGWGVARRWRGGRSGPELGALMWGGVLVIALLVATGPRVDLGYGSVPMPHYLLLHNGLPFFERLWFPYRMLSIGFVAASLGAGFCLRWLWRRTGASKGAARFVAPGLAGALLVGGLVTQHQDYAWPLVTREIPLPQVYRWMKPQGGAILDLPWSVTQTSIIHQTQHGLPLFGGMGENAAAFWPPEQKQRLKNRFLKSLVWATRYPLREPREAQDPHGSAFLRNQGFRWVILHRDLVDAESNRFIRKLTVEQREVVPFEAQRRLEAILGPPLAQEGPILVWALDDVAPPPEALQPQPDTLWKRTWSPPDMLPYERRLQEMGRLR